MDSSNVLRRDVASDAHREVPETASGQGERAGAVSRRIGAVWNSLCNIGYSVYDFGKHSVNCFRCLYRSDTGGGVGSHLVGAALSFASIICGLLLLVTSPFVPKWGLEYVPFQRRPGDGATGDIELQLQSGGDVAAEDDDVAAKIELLLKEVLRQWQPGDGATGETELSSESAPPPQRQPGGGATEEIELQLQPGGDTTGDIALYRRPGDGATGETEPSSESAPPPIEASAQNATVEQLRRGAESAPPPIEASLLPSAQPRVWSANAESVFRRNKIAQLLKCLGPDVGWQHWRISRLCEQNESAVRSDGVPAEGDSPPIEASLLPSAQPYVWNANAESVFRRNEIAQLLKCFVSEAVWQYWRISRLCEQNESAVRSDGVPAEGDSPRAEAVFAPSEAEEGDVAVAVNVRPSSADDFSQIDVVPCLNTPHFGSCKNSHPRLNPPYFGSCENSQRSVLVRCT